MNPFRLNAIHGRNENPLGGNRGGTVSFTERPRGRAKGATSTSFSHKPSADARRAVPMSIAFIQKLVCSGFGITELDLLSRRSGRTQAKPRQVGYWLARHATSASLPEIGRAFDRDHSTVMHGIAQVDARMAADPAFAITVRKLADIYAQWAAPEPVSEEERIRLLCEEVKILDREIAAKVRTAEALAFWEGGV